MSEPDHRPNDLTTSDDALLDGRLNIRQPLEGHRVGSDAILLAAAAPREGVRRLVDVGAGAGAVGLAILQRMPEARAELVEKDAGLAGLASENAARNGLGMRTRVVRVDITAARDRRAAGLMDGEADLVVTNPPFYEARNVRASPNARRASAYVFAADRSGESGPLPLEAWIVASLSLLRAGGRFIMIHRPEALAQILDAFGRRLGALAILPIHPNAQAPAHRILVAGVKGSGGPISLRPALVLHDETGAFPPFAQAIHRGEALIDWGEARPVAREPRRRVDRAGEPH
jgi:tRNA1(Val) A37 N6-methylase TrmN6